MSTDELQFQAIGPFRVVRTLGQGGMGSVYLVVDLKGQQRALKLLRTATQLGPLERVRFAREFEIMQGLRHPHLAEVFELGEHEGTPFFTMEYVTGQSLREHLLAMPYKERLVSLQGCIAALLDVLDYIHRNSVVHRDLKPDNVMIDSDNRLRLLDFGLARANQQEQASRDRNLTEPGMVVGTIHYMAPEQILGSPLDGRADLYSLGVMLFEILTGKLPFEGPDAISTLGRILHTPAPSLDSLADRLVPEAVRQIVSRLLLKEPHQRYPNAAELLDIWNESWSENPNESAVETDTVVVSRANLAQSNKVLVGRAPMVGRESQLQELQNRLQASTDESEYQLLRLDGAVGTGKSRLLHQFVAYARQGGAEVVHCRGFEHSAIPYSLWAPVLSWASSVALHPSLLPFRQLLASILPGMSNAASAEHQENIALLELEPVHRFQLFEGVCRLIELCCTHRTQSKAKSGPSSTPVCLLVLEDVHWGDPVSIELLRYFVDTRSTSGQQLPLLMIYSWNSEEFRERPDLLSLQKLSVDLGIPNLRLGPINRAQLGTMVEAMLGFALETKVLERLYRETEGNPLFVEELIHSLFSADEDSLDDESGAGTTSRSSALSQRFFNQESSIGNEEISSAFSFGRSATMKKAVQRRISMLPDSLRELLEAAAIGGFTIDFELLSKIQLGKPSEENAKLKASKRSDIHLYESLASLAHRKVLVENQQFFFANQQTLEVVLESLDEDRKVELHGLWVKALEHKLQTDGKLTPQGLSELTIHCQNSGQIERAITLLHQAATEALKQFAFQEACVLFEQIESLQSLRDESDEGLSTSELQSNWDIRELQADALYGAGSLEPSLAKYQSLKQEFDHWAQLPRTQQEDPALISSASLLEMRVRIRRKFGNVQERLGLLDEAQASFLEAFGLLNLRVTADPSSKAKFLTTLGMLSHNFFASLDSHGTWAVQEIHRIGDRLTRVLYLLRPKAWSNDFLNLILLQFRAAWRLRELENDDSPGQSMAQVLLVGGYISLRGLNWGPAARSSLMLAAQKTEELKDSTQKAALLRDTGYVLLLSGSPDKARQLLERALQVSTRIGDAHGLSQNYLQLHSLYSYLGKIDDAHRCVELAKENAMRLGSYADSALAMADGACVMALRGNIEEASATLKQADEMRTRCKANYLDLVFGRAHCQVSFFQRQLETAQQQADEMFLYHQGNGELPFHLVMFGLVGLNCQAERLRMGGSFDFELFKRRHKHLVKLSAGFDVYRQVLLRLRAQVSYLRGRRGLALEQLADCAHWAECNDHPLEAARTHWLLATLLAEEGLGEHHRAEAERYFAQCGVQKIIE
jgi:serine/threonine protein kinase/tetratricopeptide (TPR) repeat protein